MSVMCSMNACKQKRGFCAHERTMLIVIIVIGVGAIGHWAFHWF